MIDPAHELPISRQADRPIRDLVQRGAIALSGDPRLRDIYLSNYVMI